MLGIKPNEIAKHLDSLGVTHNDTMVHYRANHGRRGNSKVIAAHGARLGMLDDLGFRESLLPGGAKDFYPVWDYINRDRSEIRDSQHTTSKDGRFEFIKVPKVTEKDLKRKKGGYKGYKQRMCKYGCM